jgi:dTDP-L-rhamnose 4-epimerase
MTRSDVVLVTGGAGFIGTALARRLLRNQATAVWVADSLHPQVHPGRQIPAALPPEARFLPFDVTQEGAWDALLSRVQPTCVVHLAAETGTGQSLTEATRHASVNVVGTTQLLDALGRAAIVPEHLVLASSRAVYGEGTWESSDGTFHPGVRKHDDLSAGQWIPRVPGTGLRPLPASADRTVANPTSVYGATKLAQEHILRAWVAARGSRLSVLRLQNVYGPGQSLTNAYTGIVTLFARQARAGETIDIYEDGGITRDFVFIDDVAEAIERCIQVPPAHDRLLDIGSGTPTTIMELGETLAHKLHAPGPRVSGRFRDGDVRAAWADITRAREEIGYEPRTSLASGLDQLLEWMA